MDYASIILSIIVYECIASTVDDFGNYSEIALLVEIVH